MNTFTYPARQCHDQALLTHIEFMMNQFATTCITDTDQIKAGMTILSKNGLPYRVDSVNRKHNRAVLERLNYHTADRTGRYLPKPLSQLTSNYDWYLPVSDKPTMYDSYDKVPWLSIAVTAACGIGLFVCIYWLVKG